MDKIAKKKVYNSLIELVNDRIEELEDLLIKARESRNDDTKSSAGDKYETAREMIQSEITKNEVLLTKSLLMKADLKKVDLSKDYTYIEFGSLVETNNGLFFFSIPYGKVIVDNTTFLAISLVSPIGKEFKGKAVGERVNFQNREYIIKNIV